MKIAETLKDFAPTKEQITLHGLGFIQVKLPNNSRMHVWHPELPRRSCFAHSAIHNHRFSFRSRVLVGLQINQRYHVEATEDGTHDLISHDGPRSEKGGRLSFVAGRANFLPAGREVVPAGASYDMAELEYHETPNSGVVVTIMDKLSEGTTHANSAITHGHVFDQEFDRYLLPENVLWKYVLEALRCGESGPPGRSGSGNAYDDYVRENLDNPDAMPGVQPSKPWPRR